MVFMVALKAEFTVPKLQNVWKPFSIKHEDFLGVEVP